MKYNTTDQANQTALILQSVNNRQMQTVKIVTGSILGIAVLLIGKKALGKYIEQKKDQADTENKQAEVQQSMTIKTSNLTINENQAKVIANDLHSAMASVGTDENAILRLLSNRTADDIKLIVSAFGVREYGTFGTPTKWLKWAQTVEKLNLMQWLRKELSDKVGTFKKIQPIFEQAGLTL